MEYLAQDDDASQDQEGNDSSVIDGENGMEDEYGDEEGAPHNSTKLKKEKVFQQIDYSKRKTKIICTLGPACSELEQMVRLIDAGMQTARINLSHGDLKSNMKLIRRFKQAKRLRPHRTVGLMVELRGREIRLSHCREDEIKVRSGTTVSLYTNEFHLPSDMNTFRVSSETVNRYLKPNDVVYFDDGKVVGIVIDVNSNGCKMEVKIGGSIRGGCQVKFINGKHNQESLLAKQDLADLIAIQQAIVIDFVSLPFTINPEDVQQLRETLAPHSKDLKILAKIDTYDGVSNFDKILPEADGVILVRSDIQWEMQAEKQMIAQKWIIEQTNGQAKPVIIQSQVLLSMLEKEFPDRQELAEISSATLEGVDCLILSHETSVGHFPVQATTFLAKGIAEAESIYDYSQAFINAREEVKKLGDNADNIDLLATTGCSIAFEPKENVDMFICLTENGRIAKHIAKQRPRQPILACSVSGQIVRQINMTRGVVGYQIPEHMKNRTDELIEHILHVCQEQLICNPPTSKVMIFIGQNEKDPKKEIYTFKIIGGKSPDDEEDEEENEDEQEEHDDDH
eukprot:CAMPEP_0168613124 /NCGR_PEP_ID=MMETSP0449_2-20121227/3287_1 /TAXON_ID=1082188 /ORGANISM="Strombidium rassoulzadegani, Strain ras09" /LENGTH=566 /DNA_ID=CAMNT_0008653743 /DNA_START=15 /DNA_END=1715 /DNA_ORIENTATION=-